MIRVGILADTASRERRLAELLAEDPRFEIVEADLRSGFAEDAPAFVDVIVAAGLTPDQIPGTVPVVALSELNTPAWSQAVHAWLPLNASMSEIVAAIIAASCDLTVLTKPQALRWIRGTDILPGFRERLLEALTSRELEVLRMLADGLSNKEIAMRLRISDHTAKFHVTQILGKLGATSRAEAVALGIRKGLIPI
ncbi:MAG: response regulator transcription factor [Acidobacteriaceae bacterium]|nr:response regulator transcription factor [Acidobacteriaceae bacterium]